ncbi:MAG: hypothetical protein QM751_13955 [Paludibacteraceae bacterium]
MIAYNTTWLNNLDVRREADNAAEQGCIEQQERDQIYIAYPAGFYSPNIFVRTGLFILTVVIVLFGLGLLSLLFLSAIESAVGGLVLFFGLLAYGALELMVKNGHYRSGVDDALLWTAAICLVTGFNLLVNIPALGNAIIIFLLTVLLFLRFTDALMAVAAALALLAIVFFSIIKMGAAGRALAPFVLMAAAALLYLFAQSLLKTAKWKPYHPGLQFVLVTALVCFYLSGNYFVVREASLSMFGMELQPGHDIPLGWLFWIFTTVIPLAYIIRGLQKKDAVLLRVGLLLVAAIVFTVRYYYHVLPAETACVIGGVLFILLAWAVIRYLKTPKHGFTFKEQEEPFFMDKLHIESLVIAQGFGGQQTSSHDGGIQFGGGSGGGGGASGEF